jgi:hypothetical protein
MRRFAWLCVAAGLLVGCAAAPAIQSDAERRACDELIRAMREAWDLRPGTVVQRERYDGRLSPEAAQFALRRGLRANVTGDGAGGYTFFPVLNPFTLLAAAGIDPDKPPGISISGYRDYMAVRSPSQRADVVELGRRCEWE